MYGYCYSAAGPSQNLFGCAPFISIAGLGKLSEHRSFPLALLGTMRHIYLREIMLARLTLCCWTLGRLRGQLVVHYPDFLRVFLRSLSKIKSSEYVRRCIPLQPLVRCSHTYVRFTIKGEREIADGSRTEGAVLTNVHLTIALWERAKIVIEVCA